MTAPAAISGTFADLKTVKTRSVVQIVVEVPIEQGEAVVRAFGFPQPGAEVHVAVARIVPPETLPPAGVDAPSDHQSRRRFRDMPRSQQAALKCQDRSFQLWCEARPLPGGQRVNVIPGFPQPGAEWTAEYVRRWCRVPSRAYLDHDDAAARRWDALLVEYEQATGRLAVDYTAA